MTADKTNTKVNKPNSDVENKVTSPADKKSHKAPMSKLAFLSLLVTLGLAGFLYYHGHSVFMSQQHTIASLQKEMATIKQSSSELTPVTKQIEQLQTAQTELNMQVNDAIDASNKNIYKLTERLNAMSNIDTDKWLISQANYFVHLAGRKIWNEQDYTTAQILLKSADESLAQTHDASLIPARQAISNDIASLSKITALDVDGVIMDLMRLSDTLTDMPLVSHYQDTDLGMTQHQEFDDSNSDDASKASTNTDVSASVSDWSDNLLKSSSQFFQKFISIKKAQQADDLSDCLKKAGQDQKTILQCKIMQKAISADDALYLRENIRLRLLIAAQAVPRHQDLIYQRALNDVDIWVNAYFDNHSASVKAFLSELNKLQQESITNKNIPERLASSVALEKIMKARVLSTLVK